MLPRLCPNFHYGYLVAATGLRVKRGHRWPSLTDHLLLGYQNSYDDGHLTSKSHCLYHLYTRKPQLLRVIMKYISRIDETVVALSPVRAKTVVWFPRILTSVFDIATIILVDSRPPMPFLASPSFVDYLVTSLITWSSLQSKRS